VPVWAPPSVGASYNRAQDLAKCRLHSDRRFLDAEAHPVGFSLGDESERTGRHDHPCRSTFLAHERAADIWVPIRAGTDIVFLGGLINHLIEYDSSFRVSSFITRMPPAFV